MRLWPLFSFCLLGGCVQTPALPEPVDQAVKARYWEIQAAQRQLPPTAPVRLPLRKPARFEDGAHRVPSTEDIIVTRHP
ncbi:MAG: hypothetical protein Q8M02_13225 [Candidatus Didemnitutus sp.]|nr:hypothetical protein [Candidatus Didemnitutus sp.]